ncbi:FtsQ-type POTRA domain-containing protein [Patescibacteria group bacterium]|nr:FtsQ-type POTRA domain-containing protein [Patescibacteria group bacterium]
MRSKSAPSSHYLKESRKKKQSAFKKRAFIWVALGVIAFVGFILIFHIHKLNIRNIEVTGNSVVDSKEIQDTVKETLVGNYLFVFPKTNFLIYPKDLIKTNLENKFKVLKNTTVTLKGVSDLDINVSEREGKYTWCGDSPLADSSCYFMDDLGYIFGLAPFFSGDVYLKFYGEVAKDNPDPSGFFYFKDYFAKLLQFRDAVTRMGVKTNAYLVKNDGTAELYINSPTPFPDKQKIIFNPNEDISKLAENLQTALGADPLQSNFKKEFNSLLYIDLRYGNKVYYKFK